MEEKRQKYFIFGGVGLVAAVVIIFWAANFNFIMDGGFAGNKKIDGTWDGIKDNLAKTMGVMKNELAGSKKASLSSTAEQAELLKIMKEKIEGASSTASSR